MPTLNVITQMKSHPDYAKTRAKQLAIKTQIQQQAVPIIHTPKGQATYKALDAQKVMVDAHMLKIRLWAEVEIKKS